MATPIDTVAGLLRDAEATLFVTGAGLSADSGLPTYRGVGGLYERELTDEGIPIEVALSGEMLGHRPDLSWKYLWEIGAACAGATFNRGHEVIAEVERRKPGTWVLTQNVDGFHHAAGSRNLIEVHGRMSTLTCVECDHVTTAEAMLESYGGEPELPPRCPECRGVVRPDVVLFGEMLPANAIAQLDALADREPDLVIVVGTSGVFPYVVDPVLRASAAGATTVEINPVESAVSGIVEHRIAGTAAETLDRLWQASR